MKKTKNIKFTNPDEEKLYKKLKKKVLSSKTCLKEKLEIVNQAVDAFDEIGYDFLSFIDMDDERKIDLFKDREVNDLIKQGYAKGNAYCAYALGRIARASFNGEDSIKYFEKGASSVEPDSMFYLALTYIEPYCGRVDLVKGKELMEEAFKQGSPLAAMFLGREYLEDGMYSKEPKAVETAFHYLSKADIADVRGCHYYLAMILMGAYPNTPYPLIDEEFGLDVLEHGFRVGDVKCIRTIGDFYFQGKFGYVEDPITAGLLYRRAGIYGGDPESCATLLDFENELDAFLIPGEKTFCVCRSLLSIDEKTRIKAKDCIIADLRRLKAENAISEIEKIDVKHAFYFLDKVAIYDRILNILSGYGDKKIERC